MGDYDKITWLTSGNQRDFEQNDSQILVHYSILNVIKLISRSFSIIPDQPTRDWYLE